jgi:hypothetical protein
MTANAYTEAELTALGASLIAAQPHGDERPYASLGPQADELRTDFNAETEKVRLVMLAAPTCGLCLQGVTKVQRVLLSREPDPKLRPYVVWVPELGGREEDVPVATGFVPDARATHYWDGLRVMMRGYRAVLEVPEDPWDVYLVYGPGTRWESELPPKPDYWMQQLWSEPEPRVKGPYLDPEVFADKVITLLKALG